MFKKNVKIDYCDIFIHISIKKKNSWFTNS